MRLNKTNLKKIIHKIVSEDREPLKDILDHEVASDVTHALHDTWAGGERSGRWNTPDDQKVPEQGNLVQPIDHAAAAGAEPVTRGIEVIDHSTGKVVQMTESQLRSAIKQIILKSS